LTTVNVVKKLAPFDTHSIALRATQGAAPATNEGQPKLPKFLEGSILSKPKRSAGCIEGAAQATIQGQPD